MSQEVADTVEVNVKLSRGTYELLYKYCDWAGFNIDSLVEQLVFESISSDLGFKANPRFQKEIKSIGNRL